MALPQSGVVSGAVDAKLVYYDLPFAGASITEAPLVEEAVFQYAAIQTEQGSSVVAASSTSAAPAANTGIAPPPVPANDIDPDVVQQLRDGIAAQRQAGFPNYQPRKAFVVDPSRQQMMVIDLNSWTELLKIPVGTGKNGLGTGSAQTPTGFFTMGGVRIAKDASAYIQTGDSKRGVSGVYAEMLYPPSHEKDWERGKVPNNVIIHGFNPSVSSMLKERHSKKLIGRVPCTTGCPVPNVADLPKLAPFLKDSAGTFDISARPNDALRHYIRTGQVTEYYNAHRLGDPILILNRPFSG